MSFKAKLIVFSRYGLSIVAAFLMQAIFYKIINEISNKKIRKITKILFFCFNSLILIVPIDYIMGFTINQVVFRTILITGLFYEIITAIFIFVFIICRAFIFKFTKDKDKNGLIDKSVGRRAFIFGVSSGILLGIPILKSIYNALRNPRIKKIKIKTGLNLSRPFKILQITDMHTGYFFGPSQIRFVKDSIERLSPDIVCFTGDQLHNSHEPFLDMLSDNLRGIDAKFGVYQVAGNHDHRLGTSKLYSRLESISVHPLVNSHTIIKRDDFSLKLTGIDDLHYGGSLKKAFENSPDADYSILLSHRPDALENGYKFKVNLILAGHTHGGQLCLGDLCPSRFETPYTYGLYSKNGTKMYVSSGAGTTGPPMRLFSRSELALISLV